METFIIFTIDNPIFSGYNVFMSKQSEALKNKYGQNYFSELGKLGAKKFYQLYYLAPIQLTKFGIFRKNDNSFVNFLGYQK
jgi:hypothetical protein